MITTTTYHKDELKSGECPVCNDTSDEILASEGICVDCHEENKFYEETMKGL